ncbi:CRACD-like protein isoform X2 [Amphibalanus amphitrite]|nr:CRACD-like protein isoform X2 [Amphibalanus amphitrite]
MSQPMDKDMSDSEMDRILEEYGLYEDEMTRIEKRQLIQTLEVSKISAQSEQESRLKKEDDVVILQSSPALKRHASSAGTSMTDASPGAEPSPLIGGAALAQRRRPLRAPAGASRTVIVSEPVQRESQTADSRAADVRTADSRTSSEPPKPPAADSRRVVVTDTRERKSRTSGNQEKRLRSTADTDQGPAKVATTSGGARDSGDSSDSSDSSVKETTAGRRRSAARDSGSEPAASPADSGSEPAASPADSGSEPAASPADSGSEPAASPADSGSEPAASPADSGSEPAASPADSGSEPAASPADSGSEPAASPADSGSEPAASPADSGSEPAASPADSPPASPPRPKLYYVNHEGRREAVERSERATRLLELLSDGRSVEENVHRVLRHLEQQQERALAAAEQRTWQDDIPPSRTFHESSLPSRLDPARLEYRPKAPLARKRSAAPDTDKVPAARKRSAAPESGKMPATRRKPSVTPEPDKTPSPEPPPSPQQRRPTSPPPQPREPGVSGGLPTVDGGRQHSRASQLLQRAIDTHSAKKRPATTKLSLKLSTRPRPDAAAADGSSPPERPSSSGGPLSRGTALSVPLLPELSAEEEPPSAAAPPARRRPVSPVAGPSGLARQSRRRLASAEIRPAPLRLPRRSRLDQNGRVMVPLVTKVQAPGGPSKQPAASALTAGVNSSSSDDDGGAPATSRARATGRGGRLPATGGNRLGSSDATTGRPGPSDIGRSRPSSSGDGGDGVLATPSGTSNGAAAAASGDAAGQRVQCPLCAAFFPSDKIEAHASRCEGDDVMEIEESPSPPMRRSATNAIRERTPRGHQRCRLCDQLLEEGPAYLDHVDECLRRRRQSPGGEANGVPEDVRPPLTVPLTPVQNGSGRHANTGIFSGSGFSPTFQRISAQTGSCIDYHNQFSSAGRLGGGTGRKKGARGRGRRGGGRARGRARARRS